MCIAFSTSGTSEYYYTVHSHRVPEVSGAEGPRHHGRRAGNGLPRLVEAPPFADVVDLSASYMCTAREEGR